MQCCFLRGNRAWRPDVPEEVLATGSYCFRINSSRHNGEPPRSVESIRSPCPGRKPWQGAVGDTKI